MNHPDYTDLREYFVSRLGQLPSEDVLAQAAAQLQGRACVLCGATPANHPFVFNPPQPEVWGGTPGAMRFILDVLCAPCLSHADVWLAVEAKLAQAMIGRSN